ncbi:MAG: hypothetical protein U1C33_01760, partial [Candidatus Cloacimonadaceae bacterium]|nr:hypothetical protein [Candidatus Cloacimonadaceae bacterium]
MLVFALYVSNHGFGHAARVAALAKEFAALGIYCHIRSNRPGFIFAGIDPHYCVLENASMDFGVKHGSNLVADLPRTKEMLLDLMNRRPELIAEEVEFLRNHKIDLILADIPFLVMEAANYANVPVFAISNFDWVFIYAGLFKNDRDMKPVINCIHGLYSHASHAFMLPFGSPKSMASCPRREKIGLLARQNEIYTDIRERFALPPEARLLLCMFGGEGVPEIDMKALCQGFDGFVISTNPKVGERNHLRVNPDDDFIDLIHGVDLILTKPGYSTFAEAAQFGKFILYYERENYPEERVLVQGLRRYPFKQRIDRLCMDSDAWEQLFQDLSISPARLPKAFTNQ